MALKQRRADIIGSIVHCSAIRRRFGDDASAHIFFGLETDSRYSRRLHLSGWPDWLGNIAECARTASHPDRAPRKILWMHLCGGGRLR